MNFDQHAQLLRLFLSESDQFEGQPLYQAITEIARKRGLSGATVLFGTAGFPARARVAPAGSAPPADSPPVIVEIVDTPDRIAAVLPELDAMVGDGLITLEDVKSVAMRRGAFKL